MRPAVRNAKVSVFGLAATRNFRSDPFSPLPTCEPDLTQLLVLFHKRGLIRWCDVPLYSVESTVPVAACDVLFSSDGVMSPEYRLMAETPEHLSQWGNMIADIVQNGPDRIVLVENKIGSDFTHGGSATDGQLAQYFRFLINSSLRPAYFVLLTSVELVNAGWYKSQVTATSLAVDPGRIVTSYLMYWEDVLQQGLTRSGDLGAREA